MPERYRCISRNGVALRTIPSESSGSRRSTGPGFGDIVLAQRIVPSAEATPVQYLQLAGDQFCPLTLPTSSYKFFERVVQEAAGSVEEQLPKAATGAPPTALVQDGNRRSAGPSASGVRQMLRAAIHNQRTVFGRECWDPRTFFAALDRDQSGIISLAELRTALGRLGVPVSAEQVEALLSTIDTDGNGGIDVPEFERWMMKDVTPQQQVQLAARASIRNEIAALQEQKQKAVHERRYDVARALVASIEILQQVGELEEKKQACVRQENFEKAGVLKHQADILRTRAQAIQLGDAPVSSASSCTDLPDKASDKAIDIKLQELLKGRDQAVQEERFADAKQYAVAADALRELELKVLDLEKQKNEVVIAGEYEAAASLKQQVATVRGKQRAVMKPVASKAKSNLPTPSAAHEKARSPWGVHVMQSVMTKKGHVKLKAAFSQSVEWQQMKREERSKQEKHAEERTKEYAQRLREELDRLPDAAVEMRASIVGIGDEELGQHRAALVDRIVEETPNWLRAQGAGKLRASLTALNTRKLQKRARRLQQWLDTSAMTPLPAEFRSGKWQCNEGKALSDAVAKTKLIDYIVSNTPAWRLQDLARQAPAAKDIREEWDEGDGKGPTRRVIQSNAWCDHVREYAKDTTVPNGWRHVKSFDVSSSQWHLCRKEEWHREQAKDKGTAFERMRVELYGLLGALAKAKLAGPDAVSKLRAGDDSHMGGAVDASEQERLKIESDGRRKLIDIAEAVLDGSHLMEWSDGSDWQAVQKADPPLFRLRQRAARNLRDELNKLAESRGAGTSWVDQVLQGGRRMGSSLTAFARCTRRREGTSAADAATARELAAQQATVAKEVIPQQRQVAQADMQAQMEQVQPGGWKIVSASFDKTMRVWSAATGECELTLEGHSVMEKHSGPVKSAQYSPDGGKIVSASDDKTMRVWSAATGECELTLEGHGGPVKSAQYSPDGGKIVSASGDKTMRVWSAATGECELTLEGHGMMVLSAQYSPDGGKIVSASGDKTVRVWSAATGECELTLEGHSRMVLSAQFSPDGGKIVSASHDDTVRMWSAATGECELTLEGHSGPVFSAQFSPAVEQGQPVSPSAPAAGAGYRTSSVVTEDLVEPAQSLHQASATVDDAEDNHAYQAWLLHNWFLQAELGLRGELDRIWVAVVRLRADAKKTKPNAQLLNPLVHRVLAALHIAPAGREAAPCHKLAIAPWHDKAWQDIKAENFSRTTAQTQAVRLAQAEAVKLRVSCEKLTPAMLGKRASKVLVKNAEERRCTNLSKLGNKELQERAKVVADALEDVSLPPQYNTVGNHVGWRLVKRKGTAGKWVPPQNGEVNLDCDAEDDGELQQARDVLVKFISGRMITVVEAAVQNLALGAKRGATKDQQKSASRSRRLLIKLLVDELPNWMKAHSEPSLSHPKSVSPWGKHIRKTKKVKPKPANVVGYEAATEKVVNEFQEDEDWKEMKMELADQKKRFSARSILQHASPWMPTHTGLLGVPPTVTADTAETGRTKPTTIVQPESINPVAAPAAQEDAMAKRLRLAEEEHARMAAKNAELEVQVQKLVEARESLVSAELPSSREATDETTPLVENLVYPSEQRDSRDELHQDSSIWLPQCSIIVPRSLAMQGRCAQGQVVARAQLLADISERLSSDAIEKYIGVFAAADDSAVEISPTLLSLCGQTVKVIDVDDDFAVARVCVLHGQAEPPTSSAVVTQLGEDLALASSKMLSIAATLDRQIEGMRHACASGDPGCLCLRLPRGGGKTETRMWLDERLEKQRNSWRKLANGGKGHTSRARALLMRDIPRTECAIRSVVDQQPLITQRRLRVLAKAGGTKDPARLKKPSRPKTARGQPREKKQVAFIPAGAGQSAHSTTLKSSAKKALGRGNVPKPPPSSGQPSSSRMAGGRGAMLSKLAAATTTDDANRLEMRLRVLENGLEGRTQSALSA